MSANTPESGEDNRRSLIIIVAAGVVFVIAVVLYLTGMMGKGEGEGGMPTASATPTPTVSAVGPGQGTGGSDATNTSKPTTSDIENPTFGNTPAPATETTYEGTGAEEGGTEEVKYPGFTPTSDRKPEAGDEEKAKAVLQEVVPLWVSNDTSKGNDMQYWAQSWQGKTGSGPEFVTRSRQSYQSLWVGLSRMDASALNGRITSQKQLWNVGSHSLWRVTVERDIRSNHGQTGVDSTDTVTWDFLVRQDKGKNFELVAFAEPSADNEKAATFYLPEVMG